MPLRKLAVTSVFALAVLGGVPHLAAADWLLTPYAGLNWGGSAGFTDIAGDFDNDFKEQVTFGGSLTWMGAGAFGFEVDVGYSPKFFEERTDDPGFGYAGSSVTTVMGNLIVGLPFGGQSGAGMRPYVSGGIGIIRSKIDDVDNFFTMESNNWGFNGGGGVSFFFGDRFGIRGDVRYFRSLQGGEPEDELDTALGSLHFWRGTGGVIIRF